MSLSTVHIGMAAGFWLATIAVLLMLITNTPPTNSSFIDVHRNFWPHHQHYQHLSNANQKPHSHRSAFMLAKLKHSQSPGAIASDTTSSSSFASNHYELWPGSSKHSSHRSHHQLSGDAADHSALPPYLKKYNRRNRKLIHSLEQPAEDERAERVEHVAQMRRKHQRAASHRWADSSSARSDIQWLRANLFEQQKQQKVLQQQQQQPQSNEVWSKEATKDGQQQPQQPHPNELPALSKVSKSRPKVGEKSKAAAFGAVTSSNHNGEKNGTRQLSNFHFHRVATPQLLGAGSHGLMRKQILPFVAITDRRLSVAGAAANAADAGGAASVAADDERTAEQRV